MIPGFLQAGPAGGDRTGRPRPLSVALGLVAGVAAVGFLLLLPSIASQDVVFTVGSAACSVVLALSFNIIFGYGGVVSFGHASLFATGAYVAGLVITHGHTYWLALAAAAVVGLAQGLVFALVALRASGIYFAIITLAMGQVVYIVAQQWTEVTGGISGLSGVTVRRLDFGVATLELPTPNDFYRVVVVLATLLVVAMFVLSRTRFTRLLRATKDDDVRAAALGLRVYRWRLTAFVGSALFAALAGALYAPLGGLVYPELARWDASAEPILATLLGGSGSFPGPILGAVAFAALDYFTRDLNSLRIIITGAVLLAVLLVAPGGLTGLKHRVRRPRCGGYAGAPAATPEEQTPEEQTPEKRDGRGGLEVGRR